MARNLKLIREIDWEPYKIYDHYPAAQCWLYEVWDMAGRLAYVGIADNFDRRWNQHVEQSWWLGEIEVERIFAIGYRTRAEARMNEAATINDQHPVYNTNLETRALQRYLVWSVDPKRDMEPADSGPVAKRYFKGVSSGKTEVERPVREALIDVLPG